jgi:hypothetical protein
LLLPFKKKNTLQLSLWSFQIILLFAPSDTLYPYLLLLGARVQLAGVLVTSCWISPVELSPSSRWFSSAIITMTGIPSLGTRPSSDLVSSQSCLIFCLLFSIFVCTGQNCFFCFYSIVYSILPERKREY